MEEQEKKEIAKEETEEELKARLKKEIMEELRQEMKQEEKTSPSISETLSEKEDKGPTVASNSSKVSFQDYNDKGIDEVNELNRKDRTLKKKGDLGEKFELPKAEDEGGSKVTIAILVIAAILMVACIFFYPKLYNLMIQRKGKTQSDSSETNSTSNEQKYEEITINSEVLSKFTYPIMRNTPYEKVSYYQRPTITMSEFSNNDILYNAFLDVYSGNYAPYTEKYNGTYCGTDSQKKMFNAKYIDARIDNLFSKKTTYKHADFTVPSTNTETEYVGTWKYDSKQNRYIYYGDCGDTSSGNVLYYDLMKISNAHGNKNNTVIEVSYDMAFAQVNRKDKSYTLYSDAQMSHVLTTGTLTTNNFKTELQTIFEEYLKSGKDNIQDYRYTFSTNNCSYQDYCFEKGEWVE